MVLMLQIFDAMANENACYKYNSLEYIWSYNEQLFNQVNLIIGFQVSRSKSKVRQVLILGKWGISVLQTS